MKLICTPIRTFLKKALLFFAFGVLFSSGSFASHLVGGEITYQWLNGNVYQVTLTVYRDCAGINAGSTATVNFASASCGQSGSSTLSLAGPGIPVTPICAASISQSSCNGGNLYAVQKYTYTGVITLLGTCSDWEISWSDCCRNGAITNLVFPGATGMYLSAMLNNLDVPFNNSVKFGTDPVNIIYNNTTSNLNWYTYDVDGDSIIYELVSARSGSTANIPYNTGYSFNQPVASSLPTSLSGAGILTVTPNMLQVSVIAMRISEYRSGVLIGQVNRDLQMAVVNSTNSLPQLTGMNGTNNFVTSGCPGDTITFDVVSSDPDAGQSVSLSISSLNVNNGFNTQGSPFPTGTFTWVPGQSDISSQPYVFTIRADDDFCDYYGTTSNLYYVYVNGCNTNDVWPGDANSDGNANLYDLLAIGLAYNDNGPIRPAANLTWVAQPCTDWTNTFMSGINHKHADTDGNGTVNIDDTTALYLNYGLNHPLRIPGITTQNVTDLTISTSLDTVGTLTTVTFDIALTAPVDSIYGLAFRVFFDPALVDLTTTQVTYPGSIFGTNGVDMIELNKVIGSTGFVDIALTRIDHLNISGQGPVARITIVTTDNVSGKVTLTVDATDIEGVTSEEYPVTVNAIGTSVVIDPNFVGINEITESMISVHPIPAKDVIHFSFSGNEKIDFISMYDVQGKEVKRILSPSKNTDLDISSVGKGIYNLKTSVNGTIIVKKIVIL